MRAVHVILALAVVAAGCGDDRPAASPRHTSRLTVAPSAPRSTTVTVAGSVIDRDTREVVADVEVVLRGEHGDVAAHTKQDGTFTVLVPRGSYRAFVRDARVMSTGLQARSRLHTSARRELAGVADELLMPLLEVDGDTKGVELTVTVGAMINGTVTNDDDTPVENVVIHAVPIESPSTGVRPTIGPAVARRTAPRPVLGTDTVVSDESGRFVLRVPAGRYELIAQHADYAGLAGIAEIELDAGGRFDTTLTLDRGCVIEGKVVTASGARAPDGELEVLDDRGEFVPGDRIRPDGTFRLATTDTEPVEVRAWPWQSNPTQIETVQCHEGKRVKGITLRTGNAVPDVTGTIVDAKGDPVPYAYIDIDPLDRGVRGQQERADASGAWGVYALSTGRYQIDAYAPGRGFVSTMIVAPKRDVVLQLGGTGRLSGTTTDLVDGSFELILHHCGPASSPVDIDDDARIVAVRGGHFTVDRIPACLLTFSARWRDKLVSHAVVVDPDRTSFVELALGAPRDKMVSGTVHDGDGKPVPNARVTAIVDNQEVTTIRTDDSGTFTMKTRSGAELVASNGSQVGRVTVGHANVPAERVDVVLGIGGD